MPSRESKFHLGEIEALPYSEKIGVETSTPKRRIHRLDGVESKFFDISHSAKAASLEISNADRVTTFAKPSASQERLAPHATMTAEEVEGL